MCKLKKNLHTFVFLDIIFKFLLTIISGRDIIAISSDDIAPKDISLTEYKLLGG